MGSYWALLLAWSSAQLVANAEVVNTVTQPELSIKFIETGSKETPKKDVLCEADALLLGWPEDAKDSSGQAVEVICDANECVPSDSARQVDQWVAILHYPNIDLLKRTGTVVFDQVSQAILWGASAVILLAMNNDPTSKLEFQSTAVSTPVILISANISKILQALANSTRVLVSISRKSSEKAAGLLSSTLTLWATCGRISDSQWGGTVCLDVPPPGKESPPAYFWGTFYACVLGLALVVWMNSAAIAEQEAAYYDGVGATSTVVRRARSERALDYVACVHFRYLPRTFRQEDSCSICLEHYTRDHVLRVLPCSHCFHRHCVDTWLLEQHTCPLCKLNVVDSILSTYSS